MLWPYLCHQTCIFVLIFKSFCNPSGTSPCCVVNMKTIILWIRPSLLQISAELMSVTKRGSAPCPIQRLQSSLTLPTKVLKSQWWKLQHLSLHEMNQKTNPVIHFVPNIFDPIPYSSILYLLTSSCLDIHAISFSTAWWSPLPPSDGLYNIEYSTDVHSMQFASIELFYSSFVTLPWIVVFVSLRHWPLLLNFLCLGGLSLRPY